MSAADVREFLRLSPPEMLRAVLETVRLGDAKRLPPGADKLVLRTMRQGESKRRTPLRFLMGGLWLHGLRNSDELDAADCAALLDAGTAADVLARAPDVRMLVEFEAPEALMRWGLVRAVAEDRPLAVLALGLLAAEPADRRLRGVRDLWTACRDAHPELPAAPAGVAALREAMRREPAPRPEDLVTELDGLRDRFATAADAADRAAGRLRAGRRPADADLALVKGAVADYDGVRARIEAVLPGECSADLPALGRAVRDAVSAVHARDRLRALRGVQGPDFVAGLLDEVRQAAAADDACEEGGEGGAGLVVLAELIDAVGGEEDQSEVPALAGRARAELPDRWHPLVDVALMGSLTTATATATADGPANVTADAPADVTVDATADVTADAAPTPAEPPAEPFEVVDVPAPRRPPDDEPPPEDAAELSALDAFIEETTPAARTSAHTNTTRPEPSPKPEQASEPRPQDDDDSRPRQGPAPSEDVLREPEPEPEPESEPEAEAEHDLIAAAEGAALGAGRFGLAGWIRKASGRPDAEVHARWCAALASGMAVFAGPLSAEFAALAAGLDAKALADDPAGGVLAWAAAIRAGLVYPEATRLVESLNVVVSAHPVLKECGDAFALAARAGVYLSPGVDGWIRGAAGLAEARRTASREAARLLDEAPHRTVKLARATEVWKALVLKDGEIARLLALAAGDDPAGADRAAADVVRLRAGAGVDRLIDETDLRVNGRKKGKPIIAGARATLHKWIDGALGAAGAWAAAVKEHGDGGPGSRDWRTGPLRQLRETVAGHRAAADEALAAMANAQRSANDARRLAADRVHADVLRATADLHHPDPHQPASELRRAGLDGQCGARRAGLVDHPVAAAADAARGLLAEAFALLDGRPLPAGEPCAARLLNRDLLPAADVPLDPRTLCPRGEVSAAGLAAVALAGPPDWTAVFEARAARLDHEGTEAVVAAVESADPEAAARLGARRDDLVREARAVRDGRVERVRDRIATSRRDGLLTEDEERAAEETLNLLTAARHDFDRVQHGLDALLARLDERRGAAVEAERARLAAQAGGLAEADVARIARHIDAGDLTTAREFLAQLKAGKQLPEKSEDNAFGRFYPAFPDAFHRRSVLTGRRARKQETSEFIPELKDALIAGRDAADPHLDGLLTAAGIDLPGMREPSRRVAGEGLRKWLNLREGRTKTAGNMRSLIGAILKMVGLEGTQGRTDAAPDRMWIGLDDVRHLGSAGGALLPAFGSQKSPSGRRLRLLMLWGRPGPQQLVELLKDQPEGETVLVFYFGVLSADDRQQLARAARGRPAPVAGVLDDAAIAYLACHPQDWSVTVALMAPFTATNPYTPAGDVPEEMFYGRSDQVRQVTDRTGPSFVFGGRQLGKSALLRKAERDLANDPNRTVILENVQTVGKVQSMSLWPRLGERLAQAGVVPPAPGGGPPRSGPAGRDQVVEAVRAWADADRDRQLLILLDEADGFLNQDAEHGRFEDVTALRTLMERTDRRVKVVWAGLHQTARFHSLPNQPLAQLGAPIAIGPLEPQDAFDLLVRPLATLGYTFPETLAARVIAEANNAPALVQLFAEKLLDRLREGPRPLPYEITGADVADVWRDQKLVGGFQERFEWTLNLDKRYKVIAYTVALHALGDGAGEALTVKELWEECRFWWARGFADCGGDDFRSLLAECVNLGVLGVDAGRYRLRTPHILKLLGGAGEVENALENADGFEEPDHYDAHSYRMVYRDGPDRAPLSIGQITGLLRAERLVHVVTGSAALHAERVVRSLEDMPAELPGLALRSVRPGDGTLEAALRRARAHGGHDVILVDLHAPHHADQFERRLAEARAAVADTSGAGTLSVVLVAGPASAPAWLRCASADDVAVAPLRRFDPPAVRQWMLEDSLGFPDDAGQRELVRRTGGWPTLVGRVVTGLAERGGDREQALDAVLRQVRGRPAALLDDTGVRADACLAAAWRELVDWDGRETPEDFAALLTASGEQGTSGLEPDALQARAYTGARDLVDALRTLGALEPAAGLLACEPVLAAATRWAERR